MRSHVPRRTSPSQSRASAQDRRITSVATCGTNGVAGAAVIFAAAILAFALGGCTGGGCTGGVDADRASRDMQSYGDPGSIDSAARVTIHEAGSSTAMTDGEGVIVVGRILEVCASAGCWFVLEELEDGVSSQILVDLKPSADFTLPASIRGRRVVVTGTLHGSPPDRVVHGTSVRLEPGA